MTTISQDSRRAANFFLSRMFLDAPLEFFGRRHHAQARLVARLDSLSHLRGTFSALTASSTSTNGGKEAR
jgi:hypothetical protein